MRAPRALLPPKLAARAAYFALSLVLAVPRRSPARYHREASWRRFALISAPKTASASSHLTDFLAIQIHDIYAPDIFAFSLIFIG